VISVFTNYNLLIPFFFGFLISGFITYKNTKDWNLISRLLVILPVCLVSGLSASGIITIISLAIDDWSACRLMPTVAMLYGYPLYSGVSDPLNAFVYGPIGAWVYLPAAIICKTFNNITIGLLTGNLSAFLLLITPFILLIAEKDKRKHLIQIYLCFILVFSLLIGLPPLRYVAFSIHVDSPGLTFCALSIIFAARSCKNQVYSPILAGLFLALSIFSKQTFIPGFFVVFTLMLISGYSPTIIFLVSFMFASLAIIVIIWLSDSLSTMKDLYFYFFLGVPSRMTFLQSCYLILFPFGISIFIYLCVSWNHLKRCFSFSDFWIQLKDNFHFRLGFGLFLATFGFLPVGILGAKSIAGDVNHYALPIYFLLIAIAHSVLQLSIQEIQTKKTSFFLAICFLISSINIFPLVNRFPGWYLYQNNFLDQAYRYSLNHPGAIYFPWQPLSVLLAEGRLYHLGEQIHYENILNKRTRTNEQYFSHLPLDISAIAVRPYGAPASVIPILFPQFCIGAPESELPRWVIYRKNGLINQTQ